MDGVDDCGWVTSDGVRIDIFSTQDGLVVKGPPRLIRTFVLASLVSGGLSACGSEGVVNSYQGPYSGEVAALLPNRLRRGVAIRISYTF